MNVVGRLTEERKVAGRRAPSVLDWLVALALVVIAFVEIASGVFPGPVGVAAAVQLAAILPVAFRRVAPLAAIAVSAAVSLPSPHVRRRGWRRRQRGGRGTQLLLIYSVGRHTDGRRLLAGAVVGAAAERPSRGSARPTHRGRLVINLILFGGTLGLGVALRVQTERSIALAVAADRAQQRAGGDGPGGRARGAGADRARAARRGRPQRGADRPPGRRRAERARHATRSGPGRRSSRWRRRAARRWPRCATWSASCARTRSAERQPLPRLERLPALVDEARAGGLTVELEVEGARGGAAGRAGAGGLPAHPGGAHERAQARAGVARPRCAWATSPIACASR